MNSNSIDGNQWECTERLGAALSVVGLLGSAALGAGALVAYDSNTWGGIGVTVLFSACVAALAGFSIITIQVDGSGLRVASRLLGFRLLSVGIDEIDSVSIENFNAAAWGGWGVRFRGKDKAVALRGNQAVVIQKKTGQKVLVVVPRSESLADFLKSKLPARD